jgi:hypothetical protein
MKNKENLAGRHVDQSLKRFKKTDDVALKEERTDGVGCTNGCKTCLLEEYLDPSWRVALDHEIKAPYFHKIKQALHCGDVVYPPTSEVFRFSQFFKLEKTKIVILG